MEKESMKEINKREVYRHGDVDLIPVTKPTNVTEEKKESHILAYGEVTGHHHKLVGNINAITGFDGRRYIEVLDSIATLSHQEHHALSIEPGFYEITIEQEYDYFERANRNVLD